jgi:hypothetical protein
MRRSPRNPIALEEPARPSSLPLSPELLLAGQRQARLFLFKLGFAAILGVAGLTAGITFAVSHWQSVAPSGKTDSYADRGIDLKPSLGASR